MYLHGCYKYTFSWKINAYYHFQQILKADCTGEDIHWREEIIE